MEQVAFHFDIMCPYAFQTSLWIREVQRHIELDIDWRFFSLEEINRVEGKKHPWERDWSYGWSMMRIGALLRRQDPTLLDAWYLKAAGALHLEGRKPHEPAVAEALLVEMGLDPALVSQAIEDPTTHDDVLADHTRATSLGGWGVPLLVFDDDTMLFGPVVVDPPTGDAAVRLWELVKGWREFPHLYELQRPKQPHDLALIAETFRPYLEARDWKTIQNDTP